MGWLEIAKMLGNVSLEVAEKIYQKWASGNPPTQEDFKELRALASQTAEDRMKARLVAAGISLDDPFAKKLLGLTE